MRHMLGRYIKPDTNGEIAASMENVQKSVAGKPLLKNISFDVANGEILLITGPSGSGKSTVLRSLEGLEKPDSGTVKIYDRDLYSLSQNHKERLISDTLGVGFQMPNVYTGFTTRDNLLDIAETRGKIIPGRLGKVAVRLGIEVDNIMEPTSKLSGGEKLRVALGRLLMPQPNLVLLDEPTAAIDPQGKASLYKAIREFSETEGTTFVIVSHDTVAADYADRELVISSGAVTDEVIHNSNFTPRTPTVLNAA